VAADAGLAAARAQVRALEEQLRHKTSEFNQLLRHLGYGDHPDPHADELRQRWMGIEPVLRAQIEARDGVAAAPLTDVDILRRNVSEHSAVAPRAAASGRELRRFQKSARLAPPRALRQEARGVQLRRESPAFIPGAGSWEPLHGMGEAAAGLRCTCGAVVYSQWEPFDTKTLGKDGQHAQLLGSEQSIGSCEMQETLDGLTEDQGSQGDGGADPEIGQQCIARDDEELLQEDCLAEKLDWTASAHRLLLVSAEATGQQPFVRRRARLDRERRDRDVAQLCASFMEVIGR